MPTLSRQVPERPPLGDAHFAEQRLASLDRPGLHAARASKRDVAHLPPHLRVVVARQGVPDKVLAKLMGHTNADVTLNIDTQVMDDSLRTAVDRIGNELFMIVHSEKGATELRTVERLRRLVRARGRDAWRKSSAARS